MTRTLRHRSSEARSAVRWLRACTTLGMSNIPSTPSAGGRPRAAEPISSAEPLAPVPVEASLPPSAPDRPAGVPTPIAPRLDAMKPTGAISAAALLSYAPDFAAAQRAGAQRPEAALSRAAEALSCGDAIAAAAQRPGVKEQLAAFRPFIGGAAGVAADKIAAGRPLDSSDSTALAELARQNPAIAAQVPELGRLETSCGPTTPTPGGARVDLLSGFEGPRREGGQDLMQVLDASSAAGDDDEVGVCDEETMRRLLRKAGWDPEGQECAGLKGALLRYQQHWGLAATGTATPETMRQLWTWFANDRPSSV